MDEFDFDESDMICKPCKNCGSKEYDNCDTSDECIDHDIKSGKIILEPKTCDQCNFEHVLSDSAELH